MLPFVKHFAYTAVQMMKWRLFRPKPLLCQPLIITAIPNYLFTSAKAALPLVST